VHRRMRGGLHGVLHLRGCRSSRPEARPDGHVAVLCEVLPARDSGDRRHTHLEVLRPFLPRVLERQALVRFRLLSVCPVLRVATLDLATVVRLRVAALRMGRVVVRGLRLLPVSVQCCSCRTGRRPELCSSPCTASKYRSASRHRVIRQLAQRPRIRLPDAADAGERSTPARARQRGRSEHGTGAVRPYNGHSGICLVQTDILISEVDADAQWSARARRFE